MFQVMLWVAIAVVFLVNVAFMVRVGRLAARLRSRLAEVDAVHQCPAPAVVAPVRRCPDGDDGLPDVVWVERWLRPGDEMLNGGIVADGQYGVQLQGDIEIWDSPEELALLGDALSARFVSPRVQAVNDLARVVGNIVPGNDIGFESFNCVEANRFAEVLAVFGHLDSAANVIAGHALDDDCDEVHSYIRDIDQQSGDVARDEAAGVYVRRLLGFEAQPAECEAKLAELERLNAAAAAAGDDVADSVTDRIVQLRQELGTDLYVIQQETAAAHR